MPHPQGGGLRRRRRRRPRRTSPDLELCGGAQAYSKDGPSSDPLECDMDNRPPFMSYFQNPHASFPAPWPPVCKETPPASLSDSGSQRAEVGSKTKPFINIDDDDVVRTVKRLPWTEDEDVRLVSAWLHNSNAPINGNCKKNERYWTDVLAVYNSTTPTSRKREIKHLKDRFQKIKRWVGLFLWLVEEG